MMDAASVSYPTFKSAAGALPVFWYQPVDEVRVLYAAIYGTVFTCTVEEAADLADFDAHRVPARHVPSGADGFILALASTKPVQTADGRLAIRNTTANRTQNFKLRAVTFYSADHSGSIHNVSPVTGLDYGDISVKVYAADGSLLGPTDDMALATKTVLDFEPTYSYEIIGGYADLPDDLKGGTTDQWYLSAIGVPDYPPAFFGQIDFISEVNLEAASATRVVSDGRAVSYLPYNYGGALHTNRLRFILKYPPGVRKRFALYIEHFTP
jgi:hypothetical protein